jgi:hypothetical protein
VFESLEDYAVSPSEIGIGETQVVLQVKFGRPRAQEWVRCHPEPERMRYYHAVKDQKNSKLFIVHPRILSLVGSQARRAFPAHRHQIGRDPQPNTTTCG